MAAAQSFSPPEVFQFSALKKVGGGPAAQQGGANAHLLRELGEKRVAKTMKDIDGVSSRKLPFPNNFKSSAEACTSITLEVNGELPVYAVGRWSTSIASVVREPKRCGVAQLFTHFSPHRRRPPLNNQLKRSGIAEWAPACWRWQAPRREGLAVVDVLEQAHHLGPWNTTSRSKVRGWAGRAVDEF